MSRAWRRGPGWLAAGMGPFENGFDTQGDVAAALAFLPQMPLLGLPYLGLPALTACTGLLGRTPISMRIVSGRYREDLRLDADEAIESGGAPPSPSSLVSQHDRTATRD
jgi:amidase